jgi:hydrogenase maturation protein HypF
MRAKITITGIVQGVGFRPFVYRTATTHNLTGYVRNRGDAGVEVVVEGSKSNIGRFLYDLDRNKPPQASADKLRVKYEKVEEQFRQFTILGSTQTRTLQGSVVPPDIAICKQCLREMRESTDPRHDYFFITCTECGPRYTAIHQLPYDRKNTTMQSFDMCAFCRDEYATPANRRFHAQTVACPKCGPQAYLATSDGRPTWHSDPIREAGRLLEEGNVLAIKGYGGFHVAAATTQDEPIRRLRKTKHRAQKPFALMARDLETVRSFTKVSAKEAEALESFARPIVLLDKSESYYLSEIIAPGLHNVGVMLPYTGLHYMLFDRVKEPAYVMTSANPPNEPIVTDNDEAIKKLGSTADYFLFHDRPIAQRCDDSVIRLHDGTASFVRRSRGYAPAPISLPSPLDRCVLGMGAEENVTVCILLRDKAFISQHVGDVENLETLAFLEDTVRHLLRLTNAGIDAVACDCHPRFATTGLAARIAGELGCSVVPVQHHHAHAASLMGEHGLEEAVGIVCDGYGYGTDGKAWGGEVLHCEGSFSRVGHLQEQPMIGGDLATRYPLRMAAGVLKDTVDVEGWLLAHSRRLPHGDEEARAIVDLLSRSRTHMTTTSCGRILDAVSAVLGVCYERTYQGEPAVKLESAAIGGRDALEVEPQISNGVLSTTAIVQAVFEARNRLSIADLAYSTQSYLARGLATLAVEAARRRGVDAIGFSGGVAYNRHIALMIEKEVEESDLRFFVHEALPAGDGGVSFGQAFATAVSTSNSNQFI